MVPSVTNLELSHYTNHDWEINFQVRNVSYFVKQKVYVAGLDCTLNLYQKGAEKKSENVLVTLNIGGAGSFGVPDTRFEKAVEERIVKLQFAALIFTQIRSTISAFLASAGYGTVLLPLINVPATLENQLDKISIANVE